MSNGKDRPTKADVEQLGEMLKKMDERRQEEWRQATEFKPGELTPEEEKLVKSEGLNALNYIPQRTIQKQAEAFRNPQKHPSNNDLRQQLTDRFDGYGYGMFLLVILGFTAAIIDAHGWPIGLFCCLLMLTVLELSYRLSTHR
jgi:hypothetical protein